MPGLSDPPLVHGDAMHPASAPNLIFKKTLACDVLRHPQTPQVRLIRLESFPPSVS